MEINGNESKKDVCHDSQIRKLRQQFEKIKDHRAVNCSYSLPDLLMAVFAMFSLKYESLLDFDNQSDSAKGNLKRIFGIEKFSTDSCLRKVLDKVDWTSLRHYFTYQFKELKKLEIINEYSYLDGYTLISVDGVEHFSSKQIHCDACLTKKQKNGQITYTHSMLCAVLVHPDEAQVFVVGTEPIQLQDGEQKNDCERNAAKRLVSWLSANYKGEKFLFLQDALYSTAPNIEQIRANDWDFILAVKPDGHKHLFHIFSIRSLTNRGIDVVTYKEQKNSYKFWFFNNESINNANPIVKVNFLYCRQTDSKGKVTNFSWVTSLLITEGNIVATMKAGRARWKIENETFNTLKNQGYRFEHNYGHGYENLSCVFAHLMLLAFLTDQLVERCNKSFSVIRKSVVTRVKLWFCIRAAFIMKDYDSFTTIYIDIWHQFQVLLV